MGSSPILRFLFSHVKLIYGIVRDKSMRSAHLVMILSVLLILASCATSETLAERPPVPQATEPGEGTFAVGGGNGSVPPRPVKEFVMTAKKFEFNPSRIEVNKGDEVVIRIRSLDVTHGFKLDEFGVSERVDKTEVEVRFAATRAGEFPYYCSVFCGTGHGAMRGLLIVK